MNYQSSLASESVSTPGVRFTLRRASFGRRIELARLLRDRLEAIARLTLTADDASREAESALLAAEIDAIHLRWGLASIEGLEIDGAAATIDSLIDAGPEELVKEILDAVRHETGLDAEERKNSAPHSTSCAGEEPHRVMRGSADNVCATASIANATAVATSPSCSTPASAASFGDGATDAAR